MDLIEGTFRKEGSLYIACNDRNAFFTSDAVRNYNLWSCQKVCKALTFLLDNIYIRFGSKLYRQIVGISMGSNCAPLVAGLFFFSTDTRVDDFKGCLTCESGGQFEHFFAPKCSGGCI